MTISATGNTDASLKASSLFVEKEHYLPLAAWNTAPDYATDRYIHQLFEEQVERSPQAVAVICEDQRFTYYELNARANQLAHYLQTLGVGPEIMVGLYVERSLDMLVGLFGILKAGGAYVPLDPTFPPERLAFLLEDTQALVLVTQACLLEHLPTSRPQLVCLDTDAEMLTQQKATNPTSEVQGKHLAYVLYTSGSTGQPKGVLIEHHSIAAHCLAMIDAQELTERDGAIAFSTLAFDASLEQMLPTLLVGGRVVVRGKEMWTPADLLHQIKNHQLTAVNLPTAYWHQAISEWAIDPQQLVDHPLRLLLTGGDRFPVELAQLWRQTPLRSARFFNVYGPTEATITTALYDLPRDVTGIQPEESIPLGHPFANHTIYLLDETCQPVPVGAIGELHIGGQALARGYLNRPELTAERFIRDPFSQQPQARLYKTGDLARYRPDGIIEFLGRADQQVKINDRRIEPGEIEAALSQHPAVRQAVVIAREDRPGSKRLVAYVVLHQGQITTSDELGNFVVQSLPEYMLPAAFVFLDALPLTSNTKVNRRALPAPEAAQSRRQTSFVAPTLPIHHQLAQIWEDLLDTRPIGITDDFFDLGGHSLLAARLIDRIERACGKKLPISTLFAGATIEQITQTLLGTASAQTQNTEGIIALNTNGHQPPFFFLHGQEIDENALHCYTLARILGPEQPFYGVNPYTLLKKLRRKDHIPTLEEVAAAYVQMMRSIQPEGPYFFGGFCKGGTIAYAIAQQLRAEGQEVALLVLVDPDFLVYPFPYRLYYAAFQFISKLFRLNKTREVYWSLQIKHALRLLLYKLVRKKDPNALTFTELHADSSRLYDWIVLGYRPATLYGGKLTLFWVQEGKVVQMLRPGWRKVEARSNVEIHSIPGNHRSCKIEHLPDLAAHLAECLKRSQGHG